MSNGNKPSALDILSCRKLVELYYGIPMVVFVKEALFFPAAGATVQILGQDPRRIKYEITLANVTAGSEPVYLGNQAAMDSATAAVYSVAPGQTIVLERSFLTDLDAVTIPLLARQATQVVEINVREVILTPSAIDEIPDV